MNSRIELRYLSSVGCFSVLCALSSQSHASNCESGFREMRASDGGHLYTSIVPYPAINARGVLDDFVKLATQRGYVVIAPPDLSRAIPTLGIAKAPAPGPMLVTADPAASLISVTSMVPAGAPADAAHERAVVCGLFAAYDEKTHRHPQANAPSTRADDELSDSSRTSLPVAIPTVNLVEPKSKFEVATARDAIKPGSSVIRGQACGGMKGAMAYASSVALYPATPYLEELLRLEKTAKPGRDQITPDPDALKIRMVATADSLGRFQFSRMKPGRYYLTAGISGVFGGSRDVQVGRVEDNYGGADVYAKQDYTLDAASTVAKFVTVGHDGDVVDVTLQPPITANPFRRGMSGSILGCHRLPGS